MSTWNHPKSSQVLSVALCVCLVWLTAGDGFLGARTGAAPFAISHTPVKSFVPGFRIKVGAQVSNPSGIMLVRCYFKSKGEADFVFIDMPLASGNEYLGVLPAPAAKTQAIDYILLAVSSDKVVVRSQAFTAYRTEGSDVSEGERADLSRQIAIKTELSQAPQTIPGFTDGISADIVESAFRFGYVAQGIYMAGHMVGGIPAGATNGGMISATTPPAGAAGADQVSRAETEQAKSIPGKEIATAAKSGVSVGKILLITGVVVAAVVAAVIIIHALKKSNSTTTTTTTTIGSTTTTITPVSTTTTTTLSSSTTTTIPGGDETEGFIYGFNEGVGGTFNDRNLSGINGTIFNGAQWVSSPVKDNNGMSGYALQFNGTNQYATLSSHPITSAPFTLMFWVNKAGNGNGNFNPLVRANAPNTDGGYYTYWSNDNTLGAVVGAISLTQTVGGMNQWKHIAITCESSWIKLYVNGTVLMQLPLGGSLVAPNWPLSIGGLGGGADDAYFRGQLDGLKFKKRVLNESEILTIYNREKPN